VNFLMAHGTLFGRHAAFELSRAISISCCSVQFATHGGPVNTNGKFSIKLIGKVVKIIDSPTAGEAGIVQISLEGGDESHREFRIENTLRDEKGRPFGLKEGSRVEITITPHTGKL
jgi:hypothetical protein